jgi:hypothetical protein
VGAGLVAARHERRGFGLDRFQRGLDILALDAGGIGLRPDQHEVVVHHVKPLHAKSVGDEFFLLRSGVDEHHVGIAAPRGVERLAGALRDHLDVDIGFGLEQRQQIAEQPGILRRGGRGHHDRAILRVGRRETGEDAEHEG